MACSLGACKPAPVLNFFQIGTLFACCKQVDFDVYHAPASMPKLQRNVNFFLLLLAVKEN